MSEREPSPPASAASSAADAAERVELRRILTKRQTGATLSRRDIAFLRAYEAKREAEQRETAYRSVHQEVLLEMLGGVPRKTMREWEAAGLPFVKGGKPKLYDLFSVLPWLRNRWQRGDDAGEMASAKHGLLTERMLKTRLERMILEGELIPKADKEAQDVQKINAVRAGLLNMSTALLPVIESATSPEERKKAIDDHVEYLLREFSGQKGSKSDSGSDTTPEV